MRAQAKGMGGDGCWAPPRSAAVARPQTGKCRRERAGRRDSAAGGLGRPQTQRLRGGLAP